MKQIYLIVIASMIAYEAFGQPEKLCVPCLPEGITFSMQTQIDNFQANYPGCTRISGDVTIKEGSWSNIQNLDGLNVLTSIGGNLEISGNVALQSLTGLDNLVSIGGGLKLDQNLFLNTLQALENLESLGDYLIIADNTYLTSLEPLHNLDSVKGGLKIGSNGMNSMAGLNNLTFIGGDLDLEGTMFSDLAGLDHLAKIAGSCLIASNYFMHNLEGAESLTFIGGCMDINSNPNMTSLAGFDSLTFIGDSAIIHWNDAMISLNGMGKVATIGGDLGIFDNYGLTSTTGFTNLTSVGGDLEISGNQILSSLAGFDHLATIGEDLNIIYNFDLNTLAGLEAINTVGGDLYIYHNDGLISLAGLENLNIIGGDLHITTNYILSSLTGLDNLISIGNNVIIDQNHNLTSLAALGKLTSAGGNLSFYENALANFTGLEGLHSILGDLIIFSHDSLSGLAGLNSVDSIGGSFKMFYNTRLPDLKGLDVLKSVGGDFTMEHNDGLADFKGIDKLTFIGGSLLIENNAALVSFKGLDSLKSLGGDIKIDLNENLTSLSGLDSINAGSVSNLHLFNNPLLSDCAVHSVCDYLSNPVGTVEIHDNADRCNSRKEVKSWCDSLFVIYLTFTGVDIYSYLKLDSIRVMNRTQGKDTVICWPDTTLTVERKPGDRNLYIGYSRGYPNGIPEINMGSSSFQLFQNYPNPVKEQSIVSLYIPEPGSVNIMVTDIRGRVVISSSLNLEKGIHSFKFTPGCGNLFFLTARWNGISRSIKILAEESNSGKRCKLDHTGIANGEPLLKVSSDEAEFVIHESGILDTTLINKSTVFQFATNIPCPETPTVAYEGQVYNTIQINSQCWLKENLNTGTMIAGTMEMTDNGIIEKYCYNDDPDNCAKYGALYQWHEMMQYKTQQGVRGICPWDWHIPTNEEWKVLEGAVDSLYGIGDTVWDLNNAWRGFDAGKNLKTTVGWKNNGNGRDLFGFSALPGGYRHYNGFFDKVEETAGLWQSSESSGCRFFDAGSKVGQLNDFPDNGHNVRCIRDY